MSINNNVKYESFFFFLELLSLDVPSLMGKKKEGFWLPKLFSIPVFHTTKVAIQGEKS